MARGVREWRTSHGVVEARVVEVLAHRSLDAATQSAAQSLALGRCHARQHHAPSPDHPDPQSEAGAKKSPTADRGNERGAREMGGASLVQDLLPGRLALLRQNAEPAKTNPLESRWYYVPRASATGSLRAKAGSRDAWRVRGMEWPRGEARGDGAAHFLCWVVSFVPEDENWVVKPTIWPTVGP